ncbi:MAG TPA: replicative DNA helicase [Gaiellaceae bacterium]|nr:replicative DNA helicase [Gaiellaceae bacterium]
MYQIAEASLTAPVPPQNLDAEESVLGAMMLSPGAIGAVSEVLSASDFYRGSHATIYRAALDLYARGEPVDAITLTDELERRKELEEIGGRARINELAALVPASSNAGHYARIVREMATLRGLVRAGQEIARLGLEREGLTAEELVDKAEQTVFDLSQERVAGEFSHIEDLLKDSFERITALYEAGADVTGVASGYKELDRLTSGFQPGNLIVVAARPSMGKSAFGLCVAANLAVRQNVPVALFTLEMSKMEVTQRLMCSEAKVESQRLRTGKLAQEDWPRLTAACDKLAKAPVYVDDTGSITLMEIRSKARRLKMREPDLGLVIVDYLQLMTSGVSAENRVQEVSQISRSLKVLARDLDVPIIAVSQLSRAVEQRHDKRPILSDLRESGCLTGDSRVYLPDEGVYRPIRDLARQCELAEQFDSGSAAGFRVLAVDDTTFRLEPRRVVRAFSTGRKPVFRLTTRLGHSVRATGNHKFLAFDGWRRLDDMAPGMRLAAPRRLPGPSDQTMADAEIALLGHLLGEDCSLPRQAVQYSTTDLGVAKLVSDLAIEAFGDSVQPRIQAERGSYRVHLAATKRPTSDTWTTFAEWRWGLDAVGLGAPEQQVPEALFEQPPEAIAAFLRHLWVAHGCVLPRRSDSTVRFESTSERLVRDVQSLLLRLGIVARRRVRRRSSGSRTYRLTVTAPADVEAFVSSVGAVGQPEARELVAVVHGPSVTNGNHAAAQATAPAATAEHDLVSADVYWDEILSIEPAGEEEVYDLTVEGLHSFVADDVVVHNSIEQDADLVMFIYRDEYYNGEESDQQGLAELHLAKHRNGPTDMVKLSFLRRFAKFADLPAQM